jgi:anhydro-N-acetylmuramic acid kinase
LVEITGAAQSLEVKLLAGETYPYPPALREQILAVCNGQALTLEELAHLDDSIALAFARAARTIAQGHRAPDLIGSHGQTVYHRPPQGQELGYTLQLGRGTIIAYATQIPTVSNFRVADIAAGGQGAPLVSKVDAYLLSHPTHHRCIQNLGGIGNVTYLPPRQGEGWEEGVYGWDTGPGNVLIDLAVQKLSQGKLTYDKNGDWARRGTPCLDLVQQWLEQDFFGQIPPKSTGRELFSPSYLAQLEQEAQGYHLGEADWLATLTELTVASVVWNYRQFLPHQPDEVLLCGGGSRNLYLRERLQMALGEQSRVLTTDAVGLNGDFKEAIAFAVLAYWRYVCQFPGNLPRVTGAKQPMLLGEVNLI